MIILQIPSEMGLSDGRELFKYLYNNNNTSCGNECFFFEEDGKEKYISFARAMLLQGRVLRKIHKSDWKFKNMSQLHKDVSKAAHKACNGEKLTSSDYYPVKNWYTKTN